MAMSIALRLFVNTVGSIVSKIRQQPQVLDLMLNTSIASAHLYPETREVHKL